MSSVAAGVIREEAAAKYRIYTTNLDCPTSERNQLINITAEVNAVVARSGIRNGTVHIQSLHTTTALMLNEWQDALVYDIRTLFSQIVLRDSDWRHNDERYSDCDRKNADSHLRGMLLGQTMTLQVRNTAILLGTWQQLILVEFDGPRSRSLSVQVAGI